MAEGEPAYMDYPPLRALFMITTQGIPDLKHPEQWSQDFRDFVKVCLQEEPGNRPSSIELSKHPFLTQACDAKDVVKLAENAQRIRQSFGIA